jgi:hypothetical protein
MGDDWMTEVATVALAIMEPKRPGKAVLKDPKERAEVAVKVEFNIVMIGVRSGGRRKRDRRRRRDESRGRRRF